MSPLQIVLRVNQASQTALLVVGMSLQLLAKQPLNVPRMGIEPTTFRLRVKCLIHLATELPIPGKPHGKPLRKTCWQVLKFFFDSISKKRL